MVEHTENKYLNSRIKSPSLSVFTLCIYELNSVMQRQRLAEWIENT